MERTVGAGVDGVIVGLGVGFGVGLGLMVGVGVGVSVGVGDGEGEMAGSSSLSSAGDVSSCFDSDTVTAADGVGETTAV